MDSMAGQSGFSIIVCTFNGATRLAATLQSLAALNRQGCRVELIVVNNACTDDTDAVVAGTWHQSGTPFPMRLLHMPTPGKSHALMLAFDEAAFELIVICDDDNRLSPDYLQVAADIMAGDPRIGIAGGRAEAVADQPLPAWFYEIQYAYACGCPYNISADFTGRAMLWGAGMVLRKKVATTIMHPDCPTALTGRNAGRLTAGEDDEKCVRTWLLGYKTWFDYRLLLWHFMPAERLTQDYAARLQQGFTEQGPYISAYRRLFDYQFRYRHSYHPLRQFFAWIISILMGKASMRKASSEMLTIATGIQWWSNPFINNALNFQAFANSRGLMYHPIPKA